MAIRIIDRIIDTNAAIERPLLDPDLFKVYRDRTDDKVFVLWHPDHDHPKFRHSVVRGDIAKCQEVLDDYFHRWDEAHG